MINKPSLEAGLLKTEVVLKKEKESANQIVAFWSHFAVLLKSDLDVQQTHHRFKRITVKNVYIPKATLKS